MAVEVTACLIESLEKRLAVLFDGIKRVDACGNVVC